MRHQGPELLTPAPTHSWYSPTRTVAPRLLVATDGNDVSAPAIRVAAAIARHHNVTPHVLTVVEPIPVFAPTFDVELAALTGDYALDETRGQRLIAVREQIGACADGASGWAVEAASGTPASLIAEVAERRSAELVILGLRSHGRIDRLLGGETVMRVVRHGHVPVLAVTPDLTGIPRRVLIGIDFSRASIRSARIALSLLEDDAKVFVVHVESPIGQRSEADEADDVVRQTGVSALLSELRRTLDVPAGIDLEPIVVQGDPAATLLALATQMRADLIAVGSQRHGFVEKLLIGSVATSLIRDARCSLLITPPQVS